MKNACQPYITRAPRMTARKILRSMYETTRAGGGECGQRAGTDPGQLRRTGDIGLVA